VRSGDAEARVGAGESWPPACDAPARPAEPAAPAPSAIPSPAPAPTENAPVISHAPGKRPTPAAPSVLSASDLAAQNDALSAAVAAKRSGDVETALAGFDRFLATYPHSPLTETVVVERMKLLSTAHPARGLQAARDYLARYPRGFARHDAEAILEGGL